MSTLKKQCQVMLQRLEENNSPDMIFIDGKLVEDCKILTDLLRGLCLSSG